MEVCKSTLVTTWGGSVIPFTLADRTHFWQTSLASHVNLFVLLKFFISSTQPYTTSSLYKNGERSSPCVFSINRVLHSLSCMEMLGRDLESSISCSSYSCLLIIKTQLKSYIMMVICRSAVKNSIVISSDCTRWVVKHFSVKSVNCIRYPATHLPR